MILKIHLNFIYYYYFSLYQFFELFFKNNIIMVNNTQNILYQGLKPPKCI